MRDIINRNDIEKLVEAFYLKAVNDKLIGYLFTEIAEIELEKHLPVITDFWEMLLFRNVNFQEKYARSPMLTHILLNQKENLKPEHFKRWIKLFCETIDELFSGETANLAKVRAISVAKIMNLKFNGEKRDAVQVFQ